MSTRMRKKPNLDIRKQNCARVREDNPASNYGKWREAFPHREKEGEGRISLSLEIGCGKGKFICETAAQRPDELFVALERVPEALVMATEKACAEGINNVRYVEADAATLGEYFSPGEIDRIYINFCDPWRKKRHTKRRLVYRDFLKLYARLLSPEGRIIFKTDNRALFDFAIDELADSAFKADSICYDLAASGIPNIMTEYETKFTEMGMPIYRLEASLR